jgi:hypothetical protein
MYCIYTKRSYRVCTTLYYKGDKHYHEKIESLQISIFLHKLKIALTTWDNKNLGNQFNEKLDETSEGGYERFLKYVRR